MDTKRDLVQLPLTAAAAASDTDGLILLFKKKKKEFKIKYIAPKLYTWCHMAQRHGAVNGGAI